MNSDPNRFVERLGETRTDGIIAYDMRRQRETIPPHLLKQIVGQVRPPVEHGQRFHIVREHRHFNFHLTSLPLNLERHNFRSLLGGTDMKYVRLLLLTTPRKMYVVAAELTATYDDEGTCACDEVQSERLMTTIARYEIRKSHRFARPAGSRQRRWKGRRKSSQRH